MWASLGDVQGPVGGPVRPRGRHLPHASPSETARWSVGIVGRSRRALNLTKLASHQNARRRAHRKPWSLSTKTHAQAYKHAERHRIPKREVPTYRVIEPAEAKPAPGVPDADVRIEESARLHRLFIANIPYSLSKSDVVSWLSTFCDVRGVDLPPGMLQYGSANRGFVFATVAYSGDTEALVSRLDGTIVQGRRLHVARTREPGTA